jgi:acyl-CoA synthetase (AMP-forming)/AMP-acid ligase II
MVVPETLRAFASRFERYGFRAEALRPVYGLAENVVGCTFSSGVRIDRIDRSCFDRAGVAQLATMESAAVREVASVGTPLDGQSVRIARDGEAESPERVVGEVQISGNCIMKAYHRRPRETENAFSADGWLRTGDLGYIADGELFIVGRSKDVIKRAGARLDAADVQAIVGALAGVRDGRCAVFGVLRPSRGTEELVIVAETRLKRQDELSCLKDRVVQAVRQGFAITPDVVCLVRPGRLARSTSGKIRNAECRRRFVDGALASLA